MSRCPHAIDPEERCPSGCYYAQCSHPQRTVTADPALVFDATVDRRSAMKEVCLTCAFFLTRGPRIP